MIFTVTLNPALDRELTVPAFAFDTVLRATATRLDWGGKGFNVSRALRALDVTSTATGFVGGPTGERMAEGLKAGQINTDFVWTTGETRTNVSIVDERQYIKVNEPGPAISPAEQDVLRDKVRALAGPGDWWVLSGSRPPGVAAAFYAGLIDIVQAAGARAVLDTGGEALRLGCEAGAFLVKPNREEAATLTGEPLESMDEVRAAIRDIHTMGAQHVALSLGKDGALFSDRSTLWTAMPPTIQERNPTGAGDAMVAGLVYALSESRPLPEALRWGVACGAAAASLSGTAMGTREQVLALVEDVTIHSSHLG